MMTLQEAIRVATQAAKDHAEFLENVVGSSQQDTIRRIDEAVQTIDGYKSLIREVLP